MSRAPKERRKPRPQRRPDATAGAHRPAHPQPAKRHAKGIQLPIPEDQLRAAALPILLVVTALVHVSALGTFFAQDDVNFLARARGIVPTPWSLARPLSEGWTWRLLDSAFGFHPLPYHLFNFALHLINTTLVFLIGRRLLQGRVAAFAAGLLFGASSIAFTPLHWISGLVELMAATFALAAFLLYLIARNPQDAPGATTPPDTPSAAGGVATTPAPRERNGLRWLSAFMVILALLSKESAILFPLVLLVANRRLGPRAPARALLPQTIATVAYAVALLFTLRFVHYIGSETYSMTANPGFVLRNLSTYLRWLVGITEPVRDGIAAMDPDAWKLGLPVGLAIAAILWTQRRARRHPEEVGAAWFLAFLAPVVALQHHTYLYYLYLPWPGMCWLLAGAGQRALRGRAPAFAWPAAALLFVFVAIEAWNVRAREHVMVGPFERDKTIREARLLKNALTDLRNADLKPGDRIAFVNPAPRQHVAFADTAVAVETVLSYVPLEGALRRGEAVQVFLPGVEYLGFGNTIPPEWEDAHVFLYQDDGTMRPLGRGSQALAELGTFMLRLRDWEKAQAMFLRSRARGDTLADATFGLIITEDFLGKTDESERYAEEFMRRWPNDSRAEVVRQGKPPKAP